LPLPSSRFLLRRRAEYRDGLNHQGEALLEIARLGAENNKSNEKKGWRQHLYDKMTRMSNSHLNWIARQENWNILAF
jgi:hypothetical protein